MTAVLKAISLIDALIGPPTPEQAEQARSRMAVQRLRALGLTPVTMSGIQTKGCGRCGGTMYQTVDHSGSGSPYVCSNLSCGAVE